MTNQFQNIVAWQRAHEFVLLVYRTTKSFPNYEKFGLCSQFQRAAVSIPANIAEGYKKLLCDSGIGIQFAFLGGALVIYALSHLLVYKVSVKRLEKVDF